MIQQIPVDVVAPSFQGQSTLSLTGKSTGDMGTNSALNQGLIYNSMTAEAYRSSPSVPREGHNTAPKSFTASMDSHMISSGETADGQQVMPDASQKQVITKEPQISISRVSESSALASTLNQGVLSCSPAVETHMTSTPKETENAVEQAARIKMM